MRLAVAHFPRMASLIASQERDMMLRDVVMRDMRERDMKRRAQACPNERFNTSRTITSRLTMSRRITSRFIKLIASADRFHRLARELVVELPGGAGDADAAYAFAFDDDRVAALHCRPPLRTGGEREAEGVHRVERLPSRALRGRRALVRRGAHGLG